ncbi:hypothetical protein TUSST3_39850 [Streptomyces sp. TUS-ST3]|uniref:hypothetical protein n=1 Tax=Streptomyces sp. TUS-ST3 TaxID=3025591 RepID=UPI00235B545F|nr:hypothetical protein [Streptomyces sp. TUS-ST3]GLP67363.1 hypothetical protein TUSST3_39850 [Streptomyces sp. TUS-ST3]
MKEFAGGELGPKSPKAKRSRENVIPVQEALNNVNDELGAFKEVLDKSSAIKESPWEAYMRLLAEVKDEYVKEGGKVKDFYSGFLITPRSFDRVVKGKSIGPGPDHLPSMFSNLAKETDFTTELQPEVETVAREMPRTLRKRLESTEAELGEKIELEAALAARVGSLQKKVASLKQDLTVAGAQRQVLLRRLEQAEEELREALEQWRENSAKLRKCAERMLKVVSEIKPFLGS